MGKKTDLVDNMAWLTEHTVTWALAIDPHESTYETVEEYLSHAEASQEFLQEVSGGPHLFELRAYPNTPVGFQILWSKNLYDLFDRMVADVKEIHEELRIMSLPPVDPAGHNWEPSGTEITSKCRLCSEPKGSPAHPIKENLYELEEK